ncbi:hypothetical protein C5167_016169, partial [Papaver somniferum]
QKREKVHKLNLIFSLSPPRLTHPPFLPRRNLNQIYNFISHHGIKPCQDFFVKKKMTTIPGSFDLGDCEEEQYFPWF